MTLNEYIAEHISVKIPWAENDRPFLYVDLLDHCNMDCNICYNSNLTPQKLSVDQIEELFQTLPRKVAVRWLGGEPTIHPDILEIIELCRKYRNISALSSNGLRYANEEFVKQLSDPKYNNRACSYGITMSGGLDPGHPAYQVIDNDQKSGLIKNMGLTNLLSYGMMNVYLTAIIVRGLNENVVKELIDFASLHENIVGVKLRSVGVSYGASIPTIPYTTDEFRGELLRGINCDKVIWDGKTADDRCDNCCYEFKTGHVTVKQIEFDSPGAYACWKRGYVDFENKLIYPHFEYNKLKTDYYNESYYATNR